MSHRFHFEGKYSMRRPAWVEPILQHAAYSRGRMAFSLSNSHDLPDQAFEA